MIYVKDLDTGIKYKINYRSTLEEAKVTVSSNNIIEISVEDFNREV